MVTAFAILVMFSSFTKLNIYKHKNIFHPISSFQQREIFPRKIYLFKKKVILLSDKSKVTLHIRSFVCSSVQHSTQPRDFWPLRLLFKVPRTHNLFFIISASKIFILVWKSFKVGWSNHLSVSIRKYNHLRLDR